jgi:hypothetical protein
MPCASISRLEARRAPGDVARLAAEVLEQSGSAGARDHRSEGRSLLEDERRPRAAAALPDPDLASEHADHLVGEMPVCLDHQAGVMARVHDDSLRRALDDPQPARDAPPPWS